jgi:hypothetical protein
VLQRATGELAFRGFDRIVELPTLRNVTLRGDEEGLREACCILNENIF